MLDVHFSYIKLASLLYFLFYWAVKTFIEIGYVTKNGDFCLF